MWSATLVALSDRYAAPLIELYRFCHDRLYNLCGPVNGVNAFSQLAHDHLPQCKWPKQEQHAVCAPTPGHSRAATCTCGGYSAASTSQE